MSVDPQLLQRLICPRHRTALLEDGSRLRCEDGHEYPVVEDIPVILDEGPQTLWVAELSLNSARQNGTALDPYYVDTIGIADDEKAVLRRRLLDRMADDFIDPIVSFLVGATNGIAYKHLRGRLSDYPIPELRLPTANGKVLLDVGCNWGRWCIAAARLGYVPIGVDPSLGAVLAAKRVAAQLGLYIQLVVGDARFLPFPSDSMDFAFSYSVLQHFARADAISAVKEIGRVLKTGGMSLVQMPTVCGVRCLYHQARRKFRDGRGFDVRYWSVPTLRETFVRHIGQTGVSVDCFFGIGLQASDLRLMPITYKAAIYASEVLRRASTVLPWLRYIADSVYVKSVKRTSDCAIASQLRNYG
jgi:SAM-dependent methyltransferase